MKKFVLGLSLVLALSLWTLAQTSESQSGTAGSSGQMGTEGTTGHHHHKNAAGESEVKGCLHASGGTYTLTTAHGKTVNVTPASGLDLSEHNGHEVRRTGTWEKGEASAASTGSEKGEKSAKSFEATKVKHISATCTGGKEKKGGSSGMGETPKS